MIINWGAAARAGGPGPGGTEGRGEGRRISEWANQGCGETGGRPKVGGWGGWVGAIR